MTLMLSPSPVSDLVGFAAGQGHPDFPCLSRTHAPSSCVPCVDFSPWLRERVRRRDVDGVGEYLWRVREANPGVGETPEQTSRQLSGAGRGPGQRTARPLPRRRRPEAATSTSGWR